MAGAGEPVREAEPEAPVAAQAGPFPFPGSGPVAEEVAPPPPAAPAEPAGATPAEPEPAGATAAEAVTESPPEPPATTQAAPEAGPADAAPGPTPVAEPSREARAQPRQEVVPPSPPPGCEALTHETVSLEPLGQLVPQSKGAAQLDFARGSLLLTLRGLPRPEQLGESAQTGRPYNAYRAWLQSGPTRELLSLGVATRVRTDTYRVQIRNGLNLRRYDTLLVSAEDRAGSSSRPSGPVLLSGRYRWYRVRT